MATERVAHVSDLTQLAELASRAQSLTGGSGAAIALSAGDSMMTVASSGPSAPDVGVPVRIQGSFAGLCAQTGLTQVCNDTDTDPRVDAAACRSLNIRSMVATPIKTGDRTVGVLAVFAAEPQWFIASKLSLINVLADIVSELVKREAAPDSATEEPARSAVGPLAMKTESEGGLPDFPEEFCAPEFAAADAAPLESEQGPLPDALAEIAALAEQNFVGLFDDVSGSSAVPIAPELEKPPAPVPPVPTTVADSRPSQPSAKPSAALPAELLPVASDPCAEGTLVKTPAAAHAPLFASLDTHAARRPGVPKFLYVAVALIVVALAGWIFRGTIARAAKPTPAPVNTAVAVEPPAVAGAPSQPVAAAGVSPATQPTTSREAGTTAKTNDAKSAAKETKSTPAESAPALVLKPGAPRSRSDEHEPAAPMLLADAKAPVLMTVGKPYIPNAPAVKQAELVPPQIVKKVSPVFPELAKRNNYSTTVVLNARINKDGSMGEIQVVRGMAMFQRAAIDAVKQWRYKPAYLDGSPVESTVEIQLQFKEQK